MLMVILGLILIIFGVYTPVNDILTGFTGLILIAYGFYKIIKK